MPGPFARNFEPALFSRAGEIFSRDAEKPLPFRCRLQPRAVHRDGQQGNRAYKNFAAAAGGFTAQNYAEGGPLVTSDYPAAAAPPG